MSARKGSSAERNRKGMLVVNGKYVAAAGTQIRKIVCRCERVTRNYPRVRSGEKKLQQGGTSVKWWWGEKAKKGIWVQKERRS